MRIKNIKIRNYRGILDEEIEFNDKVNVFIGGNGAGKTTLLEAIVTCLLKFTSPYTRNALNMPNFSPKLLSENNVNYKRNFATILLQTQFVDGCKMPIWVKFGFKNNSKQEKEYNEQYKKGKNIFNDRLDENTFILPIIKYYPTNRISVQYKDNIPTVYYNNPQLEAWANLVHGEISYSRFFKWFSEHEIQELRQQRDADSFKYKSPVINNVRIAIQKAFKELNGKDYLVKSESIKQNGANTLIPTLALQEKGSEIKEILDNKSAGEKAIIALISDIAYNLSIAHDFTKDDYFLKSPGIVLIDEIEAHLHPNWQRKIIPLLTELFPNIQFFITTHSPQVIASVNSQDIFICDNFTFRKIDFKSKGMDSNTLLTTFFGTKERPAEYAKLISEFREMIDANENIDKLEEKIQAIKVLNKDDEGEDQSQLIEELQLELAAHKFDLEHEIN